MSTLGILVSVYISRSNLGTIHTDHDRNGCLLPQGLGLHTEDGPKISSFQAFGSILNQTAGLPLTGAESLLRVLSVSWWVGFGLQGFEGDGLGSQLPPKMWHQDLKHVA